MNRSQTWQVQGNAARIYEDQKVPSLFGPLAELTLQHVDIPNGARVIDIACGTGIVARLASQKVGASGKVVGVDLNAGMIGVAKESSKLNGEKVGWHQADAVELPFPDDSFDFAFCQQGFQFFPDKPAASKEFHRVLAPGATLTMTIWNRPNPLAAATAKAFARYLDEQTATNSLAPFSFSGSEKIVAVLDGAGFHDIKMTIIEVDRTLGPAKESISNEVIGTPFGSDFLSLQESIQAAFLADITAAIEEYQDGEGFLIPQQTHLIRAKA